MIFHACLHAVTAHGLSVIYGLIMRSMCMYVAVSFNIMWVPVAFSDLSFVDGGPHSLSQYTTGQQIEPARAQLTPGYVVICFIS